MSARGIILFREMQRFRMGYGKFALAVPPAALLVLCCRQIFWHRAWGNPPMTNGGIVFLTVLVLLVYLRLVTVRLVTELKHDRLSVAMKGLFSRTGIPVGDIGAAKVVEYDALADYGGYGIRSGARGKAYIASGLRAVQLQLRDGRGILIGSQKADELARLIDEARRAAANS